ncbi:MAG: aspartate--tRNA ligase [Ruminococcaceae bacterium]|nr:aspartate--tRNA ligase [Oscillospiraceae bacterium]
MNDTLSGLKRTHFCGALRAADIGKTVTLYGWAAKQRDLGALVFIDLRDRTGITQLAFDENTAKDIFEKAQGVRSEYVLAAKGTVRERSNKNKEIPTGDIEIDVEDLRLLSKSETPPFAIDDNCNTAELGRLTHRYLDLRRPVLQKNIYMRHKISQIAREYFYANDFIEIETPMMIKSTPEGARDYVVPSRLHAGKFYALPQSPQIYKQLCMIAGFDRYVQLARCFRDEDLRADRQPEFTQIDLEMSFVELDDLMAMAEGFLVKLMKETLDIDLPSPLPRMTYEQAMTRYGSDKPDTRFEMLIEDISDWAGATDFVVFQNALAEGGSVKAIVAKNAAATYTRKKIDKLTEHAKGIGAKGLAYIRWADAEPACSFKKFLKEGELEQLLTSLGAVQGDCVFILSDKTRKALSVLGALRLLVAKELDLIPANEWHYLWITEMPFFEQDEDSGEWVAAHHPFTMPMEESIPYLDSDKSKVKAQAFDLVLNGTELSSGSMRITDCALQTKMFELLGMSQEEIDAKFGFLVDAYHFAAPPHGGMGIGLDRLAMLICGTESLRDVVAFPKVQNASEPMSGAPSFIDDAQLEELSIALTQKEESE